MHRKIHFRAWTGERMIDHVYFFETPEGWIWNENMCKVGVKAIMQFTGILDKNGAEVYEGEIILDCLTKVKYEVKIGFCKKYGFTGVYGDAINISQTVPINNDVDSDRNSQIEIIGNIYQNKELLEDKSNG